MYLVIPELMRENIILSEDWNYVPPKPTALLGNDTHLFIHTHGHRALLLRQEFKMAKSGNGRGLHPSS